MGKSLEPPKAPRVRLEPNIEKILDAICFVIAEAKKHDFQPTQYDLVKTIFLADKNHLNKYGRPITFDNYHAMIHGPVPSLTYDLLKEHPTKLKKYNIRSLKWSRKAGASKSYFYSLKPSVHCNFDSLSESDCEHLRNALTIIRSLTWQQIRKLTHEDPAYCEANPQETSSNKLMSYGMLFESPNYKAAEKLEFISKHR